MDLTTPNTTIQINKNAKGITMVRKNFKHKAAVQVRDRVNEIITTYRFKNIDLEYKSPFLDWKNLDCCGGWDYSKEELVTRFKEGKKPFAEVLLNSRRNIDNHIVPMIEECAKLENVIVIEGKHWSKDCRLFYLVRKGCLADYIDIDKAIDCYYALGLDYFTSEEMEYLKRMAKEEMVNLIRADNKFSYDFLNPSDFVQLIFNGLFLGYPIESTADRLGI